MAFLHISFFIVAIIMMAPAVLMPLVPMVPAMPYLFVIATIFGFADGWGSFTGSELLFLLIFVLASLAVDQLAGVMGAKYGGAHTKSLFWGIGGAIAGLILFPPFGGIAGLFFAVFAAEIYYLKTHREALKAASGALLGTLSGMAINICIALAFIGTFIFFVLS
jgi:uncharacterized protein YqgC (DUF456 family)